MADVVGFGSMVVRWCFACKFVEAEKSAEPSLDLRSLYSALVWSGSCANISASFSLLAPSMTQLGWKAMCWETSPRQSSVRLGVVGGAGLTTVVLESVRLQTIRL